MNGKVLYFDCFSGLSGDMIISALIDVGVPFSVIEEAANALSVSGYSLRHEYENRAGIRVSRFFVDICSDEKKHRHFEHIKKIIQNSDLKETVKQLSLKIFSEIARAEAIVHGVDIGMVHFHEVGAIDSIIDVVCAAAAFDYLGARVESSPVPVGKGFVSTQHGVLPLPAPATLLILKGVSVVGTDVESELTTPTGAAIIKTISQSFGPMNLIPQAVGMGAGSRIIPGRLGMLRVVLGTDSCFYASCNYVVIEANIDDMTPEMGSGAMELLIKKGALDVWYESILMKKGRAACKLCLLCKYSQLDDFASLIMSETTTIGVRFYPVSRIEMDKKSSQVKTPWGKVGVKTSSFKGKILNIKVEYDDCFEIAREKQVPLKEVISVATGLAYELVKR
jgi:pyridinium-3,5-bisthiocarboxylic acid mononucleotide nickel chelatase